MSCIIVFTFVTNVWWIQRFLITCLCNIPCDFLRGSVHLWWSGNLLQIFKLTIKLYFKWISKDEIYFLSVHILHDGLFGSALVLQSIDCGLDPAEWAPCNDTGLVIYTSLALCHQALELGACVRWEAISCEVHWSRFLDHGICQLPKNRKRASFYIPLGHRSFSF